MKIPRDLKPGTKLWYSETEYATVGWTNGDTYDHDNQRHRDILWATSPAGTWLCYDVETGKEIDRHTPPIIRIERIASAPAKAKRDQLDQKPYATLAKVKRAKVDRDAAWLRRHFGKTPPRGWDKRIRAIARRLEGGGR